MSSRLDPRTRPRRYPRGRRRATAATATPAALRIFPRSLPLRRLFPRRD